MPGKREYGLQYGHIMWRYGRYQVSGDSSVGEPPTSLHASASCLSSCACLQCLRASEPAVPRTAGATAVASTNSQVVEQSKSVCLCHALPRIGVTKGQKIYSDIFVPFGGPL